MHLTEQSNGATAPSRRALFAGAAGLTVLAIPVAATVHGGDLAEMWTLSRQMEVDAPKLGVDDDGPLGADEGPESDAHWNRFFALEEAVMAGAIHTKADAVAKLRAVELIFERGDRIDGADHTALLDVIRWLEAN